MFKVDTRKNRFRREIYLKIAIKTPEQNFKDKGMAVNKDLYKVHKKNN